MSPGGRLSKECATTDISLNANGWRHFFTFLYHENILFMNDFHACVFTWQHGQIRSLFLCHNDFFGACMVSNGTVFSPSLHSVLLSNKGVEGRPYHLKAPKLQSSEDLLPGPPGNVWEKQIQGM